MKAGMYLTTIREHARRSPSALAVITKSNAIAYGELVERVDALAAELLKHMPSPETPVAVCSGKSVDWVVGLLAVLSAGGTYIPVDPMLPMERKLQILKDSAAEIILAESAFSAMFPDSAPVIALNDRAQTGGRGARAAAIVADRCAYGIYTSGATEDPQNVLSSHGSIDSCTTALGAELQLTADDRYLHSASISFAASMRQLITPLVCGAASVVASREEAADVEVLITGMVRSGVTVFDTLPSYLARWLETLAKGPREWRDQLHSRLRMVLTTGEALPAQTANLLRNLFPSVRIWNLYGQAETTGIIAAYEVGSAVEDPVPIGRPLGENQLYVLDENLQRTPEGELYVAGPCLAQKYLGRADLTASRFIPNPFGARHDSRIYRTGDRVRRSDAGNLVFLGRNDDLVSICGIRVDLGQVDASLQARADVLDCATVLRPVGSGDPCLVSFVLPRTGHVPPRAEQLRDYLAQFVAAAAIPSFFVCVTDMPRGPSGKISRAALACCDLNLDARQMSGESPRTALERMVASHWEELLNVAPVGLRDDFFALGGGSLQALAMLSLLQNRLSVRLPLARYFFQDPTLEAFCGAIETALAARGALDAEANGSEQASRPVAGKAELSPSPAQPAAVAPPAQGPHVSPPPDEHVRHHKARLSLDNYIFRINAKARQALEATTLSDISVRLIERCRGIRYPDRLIGRRHIDLPLSHRGGILVVAAHPDDESLGLGLTLIAHRMNGDDVATVFTTNGAGGDWSDRKQDQETSSARRITEAHQALGVIGIHPSNIINLGFPDGGLHRYVSAAARDITALIERQAPKRIYVHAIEGGHIDHDMTSFIVQNVSFRLGMTEVYEWAEYNRHCPPGRHIARARFPPDPYLPEFETCSTPIRREYAAKKQEMLQKYTSQGPDIRAYPFADEILRKASPAHLFQRLKYFTNMRESRLRALCAGVADNF